MKPWLQSLIGRIDALSLRERAFLFISALACLLALADVLVIAPVQTQHSQLVKRFAAQNIELTKLRAELKNSSTETGPAKQTRDELIQIKARLEVVNADIGRLPVAEMDAMPLPQVLAHFLRRHEGLSLVRTTTLPTLPVDAKRADGRAPQSLNRQRLELTVSGPYPQLVRYVQTLEHSLPALRWGVMHMNSESQPPQLTLQVSLVGGGQQ
jgi:MSHA biogenesis protein MshJ